MAEDLEKQKSYQILLPHPFYKNWAKSALYGNSDDIREGGYGKRIEYYLTKSYIHLFPDTLPIQG